MTPVTNQTVTLSLTSFLELQLIRIAQTLYPQVQTMGPKRPSLTELDGSIKKI